MSPAPVPLQPARIGLHVGFVALPLAYAAGVVPRPIMLRASLVLAATYVLADAARLVAPAWNRLAYATVPALLREGERRRLTGASYSLLALAVAVWAFPAPAVGAAFLYHSIGDAAAGVIGRRWGRHRVGRKSLEGAAAFVVAGTAAAAPLVGLGPAAAAALAASVAELLLPIDDNLSVPLVGGAGVAWLGNGLP